MLCPPKQARTAHAHARTTRSFSLQIDTCKYKYTFVMNEQKIVFYKLLVQPDIDPSLSYLVGKSQRKTIEWMCESAAAIKSEAGR